MSDLACDTTDAVTEAYLARCADPGSSLNAAFDELVLPPVYGDAFGELMLRRPLFVDHGEISAFADDLEALFDVLVSVPERCFDGDVDRYCDALGLDMRQAELMRLGADGRPELYGRADAYHDGRSFKLLEFNVGSGFGGIDAAQMNRAFLDVPSFRAFAERHELAYVDTAAVLADQLRRCALDVTCSGEPVVALIEGPGGLVDHQHVFDAIEEAMRRYGIQLLLGEVQQLTSKRGKLMLEGTPLDVVLRYFTAEQLLEYRAGRDDLEVLVRADRERKTRMFTSLQCGLLETKASLALLHDPRHRTAFTEDERGLIDRIVPWTRTIGARCSGTPSARAQLLEHCLQRRESLILKPGVGCGGVGAMLGREMTDGEWSDALSAIGDRDYVAQEIVRPAAEPVLDPATGEIETWQANWGIFATRAGYAGAFVRALRAQDGSIISYSNAGTRGACVFTTPTPKLDRTDEEA